MNKQLRILFVGGRYPSHFYNLANHLHKFDKDIIIDWYANVTLPKTELESSSFPIHEFHNVKKQYPSFLYKIPLLKTVFTISDMKHSFKYYSGRTYDLVSIQFVGSLYAFMIKQFRTVSKKLVLSPWGSDVHRASKMDKFLLKKLYKNADCVTLLTEDFGKDVIRQFKLDPKKTYYVDYGSDPLDTILKNINKVSKAEAKRLLGIPDDSYTITCGTNSAVAQRHAMIVDELAKVKDRLPENTCLLAQLGRSSKEYDDLVISKMKGADFKYIYFDRRLTEWEMFLWRRASDMLIHAQVSDSNSLAVQEAMLCDTKVVNGEWLRCPHNEIYGMPYFVYKSFDDLSTVVVKAINDDKIFVPEELKNDIIKMAWSNMIKRWDDFFMSFFNNP